MRLIGLAVVLAVSLALAPLAVEAQQERKAQRIGLLAPRSASDALPFHEAFRQGLRELGWVESQNIFIEYRFAEGSYNRLPDLAAELVRLKVDVIVAAGGRTASGAPKHHGDAP